MKPDKATVRYKRRNKDFALYRVNLLKMKYESMGYKVSVNLPVENNGLDLIAENGKEVIGIESTNWKKSCFIDMKRYRNMKNNWRDKDNEMMRTGDTRTFRKLLVYSFSDNIKEVRKYLKSNQVELYKVGHQDIPPEYNEEGQPRGWID